MKDKINYLREKLNKLLETKLPNDEEVLKLSEELDLLLIEYYNNIDTDIITDNGK